MTKVWDVFELEFKGCSAGNPFTDYTIAAEFENKNEKKRVSGFYDGEGIYKVRFMPSFEGEYKYKVWGSFSNAIYTGTFKAEPADSHGPVKVNGVHFEYADKTPYYSIGTTCYGWANQQQETRMETVESLKNSAFNKIRFCIFPKHYDYNYRNPVCFPYKGTPVDSSEINKFNFYKFNEKSEGNSWDFSVFNVEYFRILDKSIEDMMNLGIEADLILFHPYDRWGFSAMPKWANELYLKYVVARFSAYRNVWWSLANEYDLCRHKTEEDWESYAGIIQKNDVYGHLISNHNCVKLYDFSKPWVTHCSIQRQGGNLELDNIGKWLKMYQKPVVIDEMCYEGNIEHYWGNISGEEMLRRMWKTAVSGAYGGHSECFLGDNIWWSHGGVLHGESHKRLGFLHRIMQECGNLHSTGYMTASNEDKSINLQYFGEHRPSYKVFNFGEVEYEIEIIDTWNMEIDRKGVFSGTFKLELPGREYCAVRWKEAQ